MQKMFEKKDGDGLGKSLDYPEKEIRVAAAKGLGMLHHGRAVPQLCAALKDAVPLMRRKRWPAPWASLAMSALSSRSSTCWGYCS